MFLLFFVVVAVVVLWVIFFFYFIWFSNHSHPVDYSAELLLKKRNIFFCCFFHASNVVWHCNSAWQCPAPCSTGHHTAPPQQQRPNFPPGLLCPKTSTKQTHLEGVGETSNFKADWTPLQMCMSCFRHSSGGHPRANDLQPDTVHAWEMLGCYWFSRRTQVSLSHKIESDWTFTQTRRVLKSWTLTWINWKMKDDELYFLFWTFFHLF